MLSIDLTIHENRDHRLSYRVGYIPRFYFIRLLVTDSTSKYMTEAERMKSFRERYPRATGMSIENARDILCHTYAVEAEYIDEDGSKKPYMVCPVSWIHELLDLISVKHQKDIKAAELQINKKLNEKMAEKIRKVHDEAYALGILKGKGGE